MRPCGPQRAAGDVALNPHPGAGHMNGFSESPDPTAGALTDEAGGTTRGPEPVLGGLPRLASGNPTPRRRRVATGTPRALAPARSDSSSSSFNLNK